MLRVHPFENCAILTDYKKSYVLRYDEEHLRKYSELSQLPGWTVERILKELSSGIELEISTAFPKEAQEVIDVATAIIVDQAKLNVHPLRGGCP